MRACVCVFTNHNQYISASEENGPESTALVDVC